MTVSSPVPPIKNADDFLSSSDSETEITPTKAAAHGSSSRYVPVDKWGSKFSGEGTMSVNVHILEDPEEFLKNLEGYFNAHAVPKWQRLNTVTAALTEDAATWWKLNQYFAESYEDFEEMLLDNYYSEEVWDQLSAELGRRNKYTTENMVEFLEKKGDLARRLKLDDELHLPQLVDMFGPAVLPYLLVIQPSPPTHETQEEKIEIPVNDAELGEEEEENHDNPKYDKLEAEIPDNDTGGEVDVGREEILTDEESVQTIKLCLLLNSNIIPYQVPTVQ
ncbi:hypothetical protein FQA39_LY01623 [Lamprigera yunnana]|nr:hypothetical protein FQA39_LY01623 [Lamprigera yunnana]